MGISDDAGYFLPLQHVSCLVNEWLSMTLGCCDKFTVGTTLN